MAVALKEEGIPVGQRRVRDGQKEKERFTSSSSGM